MEGGEDGRDTEWLGVHLNGREMDRCMEGWYMKWKDKPAYLCKSKIKEEMSPHSPPAVVADRACCPAPASQARPGGLSDPLHLFHREMNMAQMTQTSFLRAAATPSY